MIFLEALGKSEYRMKCHGSTTVGERGQVVLPKNVRDLFKIKPGSTLIVIGAENRGIESILLMKAEDVTKMVSLLMDMEKLIKKGGAKPSAIEKEGLKKIEALRKSGLKHAVKGRKKRRG